MRVFRNYDGFILKITISVYAVVTFTLVVIVSLCKIKSFIKSVSKCQIKFNNRLRFKMEVNKENVPQKIETRIPLPLHPLPPLPIQLLKKKGKVIEKRRPLQTLAQENILPSTSNAITSQEKSMTKILKNLDTRFVTLRKKTNDIDTDCDIFIDEKDENIIIINDDDSTDGNIKDGTLFDSKQRDQRLAITPSEKQVDHLQVRNIKRSLKRPSSRELQGLSPPDKTDKTQDERAPLPVKRRLCFVETTDRFQPPDSWSKSYMRCLDKDYTEDLLHYLLISERPPAPVTTTSRLTRACLINWLLKVNGPFGNLAIIQTACWYLDSILSSERVPLERIQLVAVACYWIAQKLHGPVSYSSRFTRISGHAFTQRMLLNTEKHILVTLGFPRQPVFPQDFIAYLAWWCDKDRPGEIEVAASFLCMSGLMVVKELGAVYPSVIACAAIGTAVTILRGKAAMKRIQDCPVYKIAEKKAGSLVQTCAVLRKAVCTIANPLYEYKAPIEHYGNPPHFIVQHIVNCAQQSSSKLGKP